MISEDRLQKALTYLAETCDEAANAKSLVEGLRQKGKTVKGLGFLQASGTVAERDAKSVTSDIFISWNEDLENAVAESETYENERKVEELVVRTYQTISANLRATNV